MSSFHYGFLSGTGAKTEYQFWNEAFKQHAVDIETRKIDEIIGPETKSTDFRNAPFLCKYRVNPECGFTMCGFDKDEMVKLAILFMGYFHEINPKFAAIPVKMLNKRSGEELPSDPISPGIRSLHLGMILQEN